MRLNPLRGFLFRRMLKAHANKKAKVRDLKRLQRRQNKGCGKALRLSADAHPSVPIPIPYPHIRSRLTGQCGDQRLGNEESGVAL
jgi:hypothetical protein